MQAIQWHMIGQDSGFLMQKNVGEIQTVSTRWEAPNAGGVG